MAKSFNEKLNDSKDMPRVETLTALAAIERYGGNKMLLAPPLAYDVLIKRVPKGKVITTDKIRGHLARQHGAHFTCPLTAGIFINIAAHASEERAGIDPTPYWRVLKLKGELNEKFPGGVAKHKAFLEEEGHKIILKGKKFFVENFEKKLFSLE